MTLVADLQVKAGHHLLEVRALDSGRHGSPVKEWWAGCVHLRSLLDLAGDRADELETGCRRPGGQRVGDFFDARAQVPLSHQLVEFRQAISGDRRGEDVEVDQCAAPRSRSTASVASTNSLSSASPIGVQSAARPRAAISTPWFSMPRKKRCDCPGSNARRTDR